MLSLLNASMVFNKFCVPVCYIDAIFYHSCYYDGVIITLSSKNGNGGSIQLYAAWVTSEKLDNYLFFLLATKSMDFNITDIPFMSGQGHFYRKWNI